CTACGARHFGHNAICSADGLEPASATTFARVPHLQRHNATILLMTASSATRRLRRGLYACATAVGNENSASIVIVLSCSRDSYFHTIRIHGRAHSSIPNETSRISWRQIRSKRLACVQFLRSIERCGSRTYLDLAFR